MFNKTSASILKRNLIGTFKHRQISSPKIVSVHFLSTSATSRQGVMSALLTSNSGAPPPPPVTPLEPFDPSMSVIPVFTKLSAFREWRRKAFKEGKTVGFVPTMGALHDGHLSLVRHALEENDLTVVSIFVNPAQFAPHEDLATYPRTLEADLTALTTLETLTSSKAIGEAPRRPSAVLVPSAQEIYPSGIVQDVSAQKGTFIEVKGYGHQMEGRSRPTFFRGVATVVTKLFNIVEPTNAYFGQKDIQQALLLRRMVRDLLLSHPFPENLHVVPTLRSPIDGLALSSRNAYLTPEERKVAGTLYAALREGERAWKEGEGREGSLKRATDLIEQVRQESLSKSIDMKLDYIEMNDPESFEIVDWETRESDGRPVIISGALWLGKTRLIDSLLLGDTSRILV